MARGTPKGAKLSEEHRRHMSEARKRSPKVKAHNERMREVMKGRHPKEATATRLAHAALKRLGLTKQMRPELYQAYFEFFLRQYDDEHKQQEPEPVLV